MAKTLYSRAQCDALTKDYTPQMFLGDIENTYTDTFYFLKNAVKNNAPKSLMIGGYEFKFAFGPYTDFEKNKNIVKFEYQSIEQVGQEYPILQIGIRVWRTKGGKVKSEIIRDGWTNKTRFW
jgi:hypothetical protein